ncbi:hypothetical protein N1F78_10520 [Seonamhaeicola sp. MEBiC1930]|uniref:hypothetical protein n=1 Tax=Seonamhaeicola sp. MEBiC01930 TaxID=2976768 RepID=UPI003248186C
MKTYNKLFLVLLFTLSFLSCSVEGVDNYNDIVGVWENIEIGEEFNTIHELTFASNKTVKSVFRTDGLSEGVGSSVAIYSWSIEGDAITIEDDEHKWVYVINSEKQFVINDGQQDLIYNKISDVVENY